MKSLILTIAIIGIINNDMITQLKKLIQEKNTVELIQLLESNPQVLDEQDENGSSGLLLLAYSGNQEAFSVAKSLKSEFSFHEAIVCGKLSTVKNALVHNNVLVNKHSPDGFTPISLAAFFDQLEIAKLLLQSGAEPNLQATNPSKVNALHSAVAKENYELCQLLIDHGANVNLPQTQRVTALHSAAHRGNIALVKLLLENGADLNAKMENNSTALDMTDKEKYPEVWQYLHNKMQ